MTMCFRRPMVVLLFVWLTHAAAESTQAEPDVLSVTAETTHGPQRPSAVPVLPGLNIAKQWIYGPLVGLPVGKGGYQPLDGDSYAKHNGSGRFNRIMTTGSWWLLVGDRPQMKITVRTAAGAYAQPGLLPDLGVSGQLRIALGSGEQTKWLDEFDAIDVVFSPGTTRWTCADSQLGVTVQLQVHQLIDRFGFVVSADVSAQQSKEVTLSWVFSDAEHVTDKGDYAEFSAARHGQIFVGTQNREDRVEKGRIESRLKLQPDRSTGSRYVCVWGYRDYNRQGVEDAYRRLRFRPFADVQWLEEMKKKWFDHWIGKGLEPEKKFQQVRANLDGTNLDGANLDGAIERSVQFWDGQRHRLRIKTPEERFDNVVNSTSALARMQFEYPAFIHGLGYAKYGKINHGYYGFEAAGMHEEVADSLHFVAGTQDPKGRQRYFMTTFAISDWHEDMDFYFAEQVYWHWRWTGNEEFLQLLWPAARRALEHGLAVSDPDGDDLMTGYYEMWNSDQCSFGGYSALQTAMAWSAMRGAAEIAGHFGDCDHDPNPFLRQAGTPGACAEHYRTRAERTRQKYESQLFNKDRGAWSSAEFNGITRSRPHTCEQNYAIWRGIGQPMQNYMAMRYIRENLHRDDLGVPGVFEFINDWWPIQWSHHYVASGDTCASFHSACAAGDVDGFWPVIKTVAESAYSHSGYLWQGTGSNAMEMEPLFLQAVVDGLFGIKPFFGDNLLVIRPSLPSHWPEVAFQHLDVNYHFVRDERRVVLSVTTPQPRRVRAELPLRRAVKSVSIGGKEVAYEMEPAVNQARVVVESPEATEHRFEVVLQGPSPQVKGDLLCLVGRKTRFKVDHATIAAAYDPQDKLRDLVHTDTEVTFLPTVPGKFTLFLELKSGRVTWLKPLDLDVRQPWAVATRYVAAFNKGGPSVASPSVDEKAKQLTFVIENHSRAELAEVAKVVVAGKIYEVPIKLAPRASGEYTVSLEEVWNRLSPGSIPFEVSLAGRSEVSQAINWNLRRSDPAMARSAKMLDLRPLYNTEMNRLFSQRTQWRIDYTGAQHAVDWRHPTPIKDERGYYLLNSTTCIFEYGELPEHVTPFKRCSITAPVGRYDSGIGVPLQLADPPQKPKQQTQWTVQRREGVENTWQRRGSLAVMGIWGRAGASNGFAHPLDVDTTQLPELHVTLSGTPNARCFIQLSNPQQPTVFRSEWFDTPTKPTEMVFNLPPDKRIERMVLYTMTGDGRLAENRFASLWFAGKDARQDVDLEKLPEFSEPQNNILAVCCTQPYEQFPSRVTLTLAKPSRSEKLYLLTANLVKTVKCYYPAGEVVVNYTDGSRQLHSLIPPYTMPSVVSHICPQALAVKVGDLSGGGNPVPDKNCYLSLIDVVLDPAKAVESFEFRSVTTQSLLGILGATMLEAN